MKKILLGILLLLLLAVTFVLFNTWTSNFKPESYEQVQKVKVGEDAIERFRQAIRFKTVSNKDRNLIDSTEFADFRQFHCGFLSARSVLLVMAKEVCHVSLAKAIANRSVSRLEVIQFLRPA